MNQRCRVIADVFVSCPADQDTGISEMTHIAEYSDINPSTPICFNRSATYMYIPRLKTALIFRNTELRDPKFSISAHVRTLSPTHFATQYVSAHALIVVVQNDPWWLVPAMHTCAGIYDRSRVSELTTWIHEQPERHTSSRSDQSHVTSRQPPYSKQPTTTAVAGYISVSTP